jgi:hypothetical protein
VRRLPLPLALCLLLAGCSCSEVNQHLAFPYERRDNVPKTAAKSVGNAIVMPVAAAGALTVGALVMGCMALVSSGGVSGSIGRDGVKVHR